MKYLIILLALLCSSFGTIKEEILPNPPTEDDEKIAMVVIAYGKTEDLAKSRAMALYRLYSGASGSFEMETTEFRTNKGNYWAVKLSIKFNNNRKKQQHAYKFA